MSESEVLAESGEVEEEQVAHEVHEEELAEAGQNDDEAEPELSRVVTTNLDFEERGPSVDVDDEEECRSSATPTQDDTGVIIEGQPLQPRLTDGLVTTLTSLDEVPLTSAPLAFEDGQTQASSLLEADAISEGDLDEDDASRKDKEHVKAVSDTKIALTTHSEFTKRLKPRKA